MLRIAVALGNRSEALPLVEVRAVFSKKYGEEAAVFGVADRVTRIPDGLSAEEFARHGTHIKVQDFAKEARRRYPQAGVYVGVKSVQLQLHSGAWEYMDYVLIMTEGTSLRSMSILGKQGHKVFTGEVREGLRHAGILPQIKTVQGATTAEFLTGLIDLNEERVRKEVADPPPPRTH